MNEYEFRAARRDRKGSFTEQCDHAHSDFGALACAHERGWDAIVAVVRDPDGRSRTASGFTFFNTGGRWQLKELKDKKNRAAM